MADRPAACAPPSPKHLPLTWLPLPLESLCPGLLWRERGLSDRDGAELAYGVSRYGSTALLVFEFKEDSSSSPSAAASDAPWPGPGGADERYWSITIFIAAGCIVDDIS